jgi:endonuclease G, mitochondrial
VKATIFLRIFPFLIFICFAWVSPRSSHPIISSGPKDSLKLFEENYMPAYSERDEIVSHTAFTLCYSETHEQARWVAYRLTASMCNGNDEERTNNFRKDEFVKSGSALPADYKKTGYDRGHLCPAGDMAWSEQSMSESFLMSNMSPQVPGFNRGIWKNLESFVRESALVNRELYVVTAGVLKDSLPSIGNNVAIPQYYYKVLLDVHAPGYKAIGFVLPNQASKASMFSYAVSVDSVERLTGIDFFPLLPDSLESLLEKSFDISSWKTN